MSAALKGVRGAIATEDITLDQGSGVIVAAWRRRVQAMFRVDGREELDEPRHI
jgi:hypothetical protein